VIGCLGFGVKQIRSEMGLSQSELAAMLGIGVRAIQSYEQEWRQPSDMVQRMLLLLLIAHRRGTGLAEIKCWEHKRCSPETRAGCIAYSTRQGHLCWFLTGTVCEGKRQKAWEDKLRMCLDCAFMQDLLSTTPDDAEPTVTHQ
jgi:DNA-binding XRE family transcriptional regulator